jgi:23S rRNA (adenine2030-N6)-methyltransferase
MLSYRHSFHAGGPADVLKHLALIFCLDYLLKKEKALLCIDTHAGAGAYTLEADPGAGQNGEWETGLGRLRAYASNFRETVPVPAVRYLEVVNNWPGGLYPGSPLITASLLRKQDRLVCCELHPADYQILKAAVDGFGAGAHRMPQTCSGPPALEVRQEDGLASLKALLPPPSRRGLVLIDPSWEEKDEFDAVPRALAAALKRFPEGTYIAWYPLLELPKSAAAERLPETLLGLYGGERCRAELYTAPHIGHSLRGHSPRGMYGSGLVILNPPYTLKPALEETLPRLAEILGTEGKGGWSFAAEST